jgi:hypothetical protein
MIFPEPEEIPPAVRNSFGNRLRSGGWRQAPISGGFSRKISGPSNVGCYASLNRHHGVIFLPLCNSRCLLKSKSLAGIAIVMWWKQSDRRFILIHFIVRADGFQNNGRLILMPGKMEHDAKIITTAGRP